MFDHVTLRASDPAAMVAFYTAMLSVLGIEPSRSGGQMWGWDDFAILPAQDGRAPTRNLHIGFIADSREDVDRFWQAGVDAGYRDDGAPGVRERYRDGYYGAFLLDPEGNSVEAVHHGDTRRGGHIDHLWIGVRDAAAAEAFYTSISRHAGLRPGRRFKQGVQFRGAWATFTLVHDGRPPTQGLHMAFPAPDRQGVDELHAGAVAGGYTSDGAPGPRPHYGPGYYAAYVLDPDGNSVESTVREDA